MGSAQGCPEQAAVPLAILFNVLTVPPGFRGSWWPRPVVSGREKALICSICQLSWCKYSHHALFQATNPMSLYELEGCTHGLSQAL